MEGGMDIPVNDAAFNEHLWRELLTHYYRDRLDVLSAPTPCTVCKRPSGGASSKAMALAGARLTGGDPNLCNI